MINGFCLKCKKNCEFKNGEVKKSKNGRSYQTSICVDCGTKNCRFIKNEKSEMKRKLESLLEVDDIK